MLELANESIEGDGTQPIVMTRPIIEHLDEAVIAQQLEVMLRRRTTDGELLDDHALELARVMRTTGEHLHQPASDRLGQHLIHVHVPTLAGRTDPWAQAAHSVENATL